MSKQTILVVDDEHQIRKLLEITLESNDYKVIQMKMHVFGISLVATNPDLVLLDIELPNKNGQDILKELRQWYHNAIIMLSVLNTEDQITCFTLDNGATDYLTKPFRTAELLARIRNAIKRNQGLDSNTILQFDDLEIDALARVVKLKNEIVKLTSTEYNLLLL
ncbi:MAG: response regulator transcription factor [Saprospiraceae bacterium]